MTNMIEKQDQQGLLEQSPHRERVHTPAVDIYDTADATLVEVDMPGVEEKDVELTLQNRVLTIAGPIGAAETSGLRLVRHDRNATQFKRVFELSDEIAADQVKASMKNGVLHVTLPKAPQARPRRIEISAN